MGKQTMITNGEEPDIVMTAVLPKAGLWIQHNTDQNPNRFFFVFGN